jgi:hypothetical protein
LRLNVVASAAVDRRVCDASLRENSDKAGRQLKAAQWDSALPHDLPFAEPAVELLKLVVVGLRGSIPRWCKIVALRSAGETGLSAT